MHNLSRFFLLLFFMCVYLNIEAACPAGWFGSNCQYMCHCETYSQCGDNGQCTAKCTTGWFGQGCQYQDLATISGVSVVTSPTQTTTWLTDGNNLTCNVDPNIQSVKFSWNITYPFTRLRIILKDSTLKLNFTLTFSTTWNPLVNCINQKIFHLDDVTVDYTCDLNETVQELTVTGPGLKSLCSLYISGGRNVALKEEADQTTVFNHSPSKASLAVDGGTHGVFLNGTCTHTLHGDTRPSWTLNLSTAKVINRYILYNRVDCCQDRLRYFKLETFDSDNNVLWRYQDQREALPVYIVTSIQKYPISQIKISATNRVNRFVILTLCELMLFGECLPGTWGLDCNQTCPQECSTFCHPETGSCGVCVNCSSECELGSWGDYCQINCRENCYDKVCDKTTGVCDHGCIGFSDPPNCTIECLPGRWGHDCNNVCNNCYDGNCDKFTGVCDKECRLPKVKEAVQPSETSVMSFKEGIGIGLAVGAVGVFVTVVVMVILQRKRSKNNQKYGETQQESELDKITEYKLLE